MRSENELTLKVQELTELVDYDNTVTEPMSMDQMRRVAQARVTIGDLKTLLLKEIKLRSTKVKIGIYTVEWTYKPFKERLEKVLRIKNEDTGRVFTI